MVVELAYKSLLQRQIEAREGAPLVEILARLRARGCSWGVIAERLGICRKTLQNWRLHGGKTTRVDTTGVDTAGY